MAGPVLDVGCGPGRLVLGLAQRGTVALGVDPAPAAVALARSRGAPVLQRSVFDPLPGQGRWRTVLLADGNIGIGGDPEPAAAPLRRAPGRRRHRGRRGRAPDRRGPRLAALPGAARAGPAPRALVLLGRRRRRRHRRARPRRRAAAPPARAHRRRGPLVRPPRPLAPGSLPCGRLSPERLRAIGPHHRPRPPAPPARLPEPAARRAARRLARRRPRRCSSPSASSPGCSPTPTSTRSAGSRFRPGRRGCSAFTQGLHVASRHRLRAGAGGQALGRLAPVACRSHRAGGRATPSSASGCWPSSTGGIFMVCSGRGQHRPVVPVAVLLHRRPLLDRLDHHRRRSSPTSAPSAPIARRTLRRRKRRPAAGRRRPGPRHDRRRPPRRPQPAGLPRHGGRRLRRPHRRRPSARRCRGLAPPRRARSPRPGATGPSTAAPGTPG